MRARGIIVKYILIRSNCIISGERKLETVMVALGWICMCRGKVQLKELRLGLGIELQELIKLLLHKRKLSLCFGCLKSVSLSTKFSTN